MSEKTATDQVETGVLKRKRERVGNYRAVSTQKVGAHTVEVGHIERDSLPGKLPAGNLRHFTESCGDFQDREGLVSRRRCDALDQLAGGGDSAEPAIDAAQIAQ